MITTVFRASLVLAVAGVLALLLVPAKAGGGMAPDTLERWLGEVPLAMVGAWLIKGALALLGIVFLVQEILLADARAHGRIPPGWGPWRAAPGEPWPTVAFTPGGALGFGILFPMGVMLLLGTVWALSRPGVDPPLEFGIGVTTLAFLPPALVVGLRRRRLGRPNRAPAGAAVGHGLRFACIATLIVVPLQLVWVLLAHETGHPLEVQDVVQSFVAPANPAHPWIIAVFGIFVAPVTEEGVFRGLLYPSLRSRLPGGPFTAAVLTATLFALIHGSLMAFVPLLCLALVLCWVMERTNSLRACVIVHAIYNASSLAPMLIRLVGGGQGS